MTDLGKKRNFIFYMMLFFIIIAVFECVSFFVCDYLAKKAVVYKPGTFNQNDYERYLERRDPVVGWGGRDHNGTFLPRHSPAFPKYDVQDVFISLYGDSFTLSSEVDDEQAWGNQLARMCDMPVSNFGTGGYGTDQAFLKYQENKDDKSQIVILNHASENILRNSTQYLKLLYPVNDLSFKPRYKVFQNKLEFIPIPFFDVARLQDVFHYPQRYFPDDYFVPGGRGGTVAMGFPFSLTLLKTVANFHVQAKLLGRPWYIDFYEPDHPSGGLHVTLGILKLFKEEAFQRGQRPIITVIPNGLDLLYYQKHQLWPYQSLLDHARAHDIDVYNIGVGIIKFLDNDPPHTLFNNISSHFNAHGYRLVAEIVAKMLKEKGLIHV